MTVTLREAGTEVQVRSLLSALSIPASGSLDTPFIASRKVHKAFAPSLGWP